MQIEFENLSFTYSGKTRPALDGVSLQIESGSYVLICGQNGSGKSTLLELLSPARTLDGEMQGRILVDGRPIDEYEEIELMGMIGFVSQTPYALDEEETVYDTLAKGPELIGCDESTIRSRIAEIATSFGFAESMHKKVKEVSIGQKQLLNLGIVLVMNPDVLVFDEPISQLGPLAAHMFLTLIRNLNQELNVTIVMSERILDDVFFIADDVIVLDSGTNRYQGEPKAVAQKLYAANDQFTYALPSPLRIYHGIHPASDPETFPLSVRYARAWLKKERDSKGMKVSHYPEKHNAAVNSRPVIRFDDVRFDFKDMSGFLKGVTFTVAQGELHALVSANGAGKTTILRLAAGILKPRSGSVQIHDRKRGRWVDSSDLRDEIAILPQNLNGFFTEDTVEEELRSSVKRRGLSEDETDVYLRDFAQSMGIASCMEKRIEELSCGQRQLVAIGKVVMQDRALLIFDEPTRGIDQFAQRKMGKLLHELSKRGVTILIASQDMKFCAEYATSISLLFDGAIATTNTPQGFFSSNILYTTDASLISRELYSNAVTDDEVIVLCLENGWQKHGE